MRPIRIKPWFLIRASSSILLVCWLIHSINFEQIWAPVASAGWIYLLLLFLLLNADRFLMSYKWQILLKAKDILIPMPDILRGYYFATFWGIFLPSTVGGDLIRAYRISQKGPSRKDIFSSVVMERALGAVTGLGMTFICLILADVFFGVFDWRVIVALFAVVALGIGLIVFSFHGKIRQWLEDSTLSERPGFAGKLVRIFQSYQVYGNHPGPLFRFVLWTILEQCVPIMGVYLTIEALGRDIPFTHVAVFIPIIMTFTKIPISLDGYGVREGLYVFLFSQVGISGSDAFIVGLLSHVAQNLSMLPGFFYSAFYVSRQRQLESCPHSVES